MTLKRAAVSPTPDQALWVAIRNSTNAIGFENYSRFIEAVICGEGDFGDDRFPRRRVRHKLRSVKRRTGLPFPNVDRYRLLKAATEVFLMIHTGVDLDDFSRVNVDEESRRLNRTVDRAELEAQMREYLVEVAAGEGDVLDVLPYLGLIRRQLGDVAIVGVGEDDDEATDICSGILAEKLEHPCFLELIDTYWRHEAGLLHGINSVNWRFQNRTHRRRGRDPLAGLDIDPLRPVNNLLWGLVQDQQHRLGTVRLAYEVDHHYGVPLSGRPPVRGADSRSRFMQAFHNLLALASVFYNHDDDTTHIADGFPVLNALKETHLLLTEGAHNQYGDLPWTARQRVPDVRVGPVAARDERLPADAQDGRLRGAVDGSARSAQQAARLGGHLGDALPGPGRLRRAAAAGHPVRRVVEGERPGAGGELGPLLAAGAPGLHPRVPGGRRRRPDPALVRASVSRLGRAPTADRRGPAARTRRRPGRSRVARRRRRPPP